MSLNKIDSRTQLKVTIAWIKNNKDPVVQESLKKNIRIGDKIVKAELYSSARVSIIGNEIS